MDLSDILLKDYISMLESEWTEKLGTVQDAIFDFVCRDNIPSDLVEEFHLRERVVELKQKVYLKNKRDDYIHLLRIKEKELKNLKSSDKVDIHKTVRSIETVLLKREIDMSKYTVQAWLYDLENLNTYAKSN